MLLQVPYFLPGETGQIVLIFDGIGFPAAVSPHILVRGYRIGR